MLAVSVSPDECDYAETVHMIEYARASMDIRTVALPNERPVVPASSMYATPGTGSHTATRRWCATSDAPLLLIAGRRRGPRAGKKRRTTLLGGDLTASRALRNTGMAAAEDLEALKEELLAAKSEVRVTSPSDALAALLCVIRS